MRRSDRHHPQVSPLSSPASKRAMSGSILLLAALELFPDGAAEWRGMISCPDPMALQGASVILAFDFDLDGLADGERDSIAFSPAECARDTLEMARTLFPGRPGLLLAVLRGADGNADPRAVFAGAPGSLLSIRHFCARPENGEPEWVELRIENIAATATTTASSPKVRLIVASRSLPEFLVRPNQQHEHNRKECNARESPEDQI